MQPGRDPPPWSNNPVAARPWSQPAYPTQAPEPPPSHYPTAQHPQVYHHQPHLPPPCTFPAPPWPQQPGAPSHTHPYPPGRLPGHTQANHPVHTQATHLGAQPPGPWHAPCPVWSSSSPWPPAGPAQAQAPPYSIPPVAPPTQAHPPPAPPNQAGDEEYDPLEAAQPATSPPHLSHHITASEPRPQPAPGPQPPPHSNRHQLPPQSPQAQSKAAPATASHHLSPEAAPPPPGVGRPEPQSPGTQPPAGPQGQPSPSSISPGQIVFVWDLDETLIIFNALLNGQYDPAAHAAPAAALAAPAPHTVTPSKAQAARAGEAWANVTFDILDNVFHFPLVEHTDPVHLEDVQLQQQQEPQQQQEQHAAAAPAGQYPSPLHAMTAGQRNVFKKAQALYVGGLPALPLSVQQRQRLDSSWRELEAVTGGWAGAARALLSGMVSLQQQRRQQARSSDAVGVEAREGGGSAPPAAPCPEPQVEPKQEEREAACGVPVAGGAVVHCIVSRGQLLATLVKLMLFRLGDLVSWDDVYSASRETKLDCFRRIAQRFGPHSCFVAVGDGEEERSAAGHIQWPFVKVQLEPRSGPSASGEAAALQASDRGPEGAEEVLLGAKGAEAAVAAAGVHMTGPADGEGATQEVAWNAAGCTIHKMNATRLLDLAPVCRG